MKILCTSDVHGDLSAYQAFIHILNYPEYAIGVIAGDLTGWHKEADIRPVLSASTKPILLVRGNHDQTSWASIDNVINLHMKRWSYGPYNFVGCHDADHIPGTAQTPARRLLTRLVDTHTLLITHVPAQGVRGNNVLVEIVKLCRPKLHIHGHVHQGFGVSGNTINVAFRYAQQFVSVNLLDLTVRAINPQEEIYDRYQSVA
jgi:Icc-related predicted phosphoesterase